MFKIKNIISIYIILFSFSCEKKKSEMLDYLRSPSLPSWSINAGETNVKKLENEFYSEATNNEIFYYLKFSNEIIDIRFLNHEFEVFNFKGWSQFVDLLHRTDIDSIYKKSALFEGDEYGIINDLDKITVIYYSKENPYYSGYSIPKYKNYFIAFHGIKKSHDLSIKDIALVCHENMLNKSNFNHEAHK